MNRCPKDLLQAAAEDRLTEREHAKLTTHLSKCQRCCEQLDQVTASSRWWQDAARLLDDTLLDDPHSDVADSSSSDSRVFEGDDPIGELKAAGVIDEATAHPEILGRLGRYSIEREIGCGGMGVVLKGFDAELNRTVAIKVLAPHLARSSAARQRFVREGRAAAAVVHENIVAIHEVDTSGHLPTLVMHYVDGVSLQRHVDTVGPISVTDALRIASQTAAGLSAAHRQGIIHRDVKPANILLGGSGGRVWITDFGLARAVDDASLTRTGFIAGTPHYMSPEQARGATVTPASDLFSLGAVIYFMLAARPPWRADRSLAVLHRIVQDEHRPLWQVNPDVPREVSDLVDRLLNKTSKDRYESAEKLQVELESMLAKIQNPESPHSLTDAREIPLTPRRFSNPWFVAPLSAVVGAAIAIGAMELRQVVEPQKSSRVDHPVFEAAEETDTGPTFVDQMGWSSGPVGTNEAVAVSSFESGSKSGELAESATATVQTSEGQPENNKVGVFQSANKASNRGHGFGLPNLAPPSNEMPQVPVTSPVGHPILADSGSEHSSTVGSSSISTDIWTQLWETETMLLELELGSQSAETPMPMIPASGLAPVPNANFLLPAIDNKDE